MRSLFPAFRSGAAVVLLGGLTLSGAAHAIQVTQNLPIFMTIMSSSTITAVGGQEVDTLTSLPPFGATGQITVEPNADVGAVFSAAYVDPSPTGTGSYVQTTSTIQFPIIMMTSLDSILSEVNRHGSAGTQAFVTVTQNYFHYASLPGASFGFQNIVFTEERTNATCQASGCSGYDEVIQVTVPGLPPTSTAAIIPSDVSTINTIIGEAEAKLLPVTFTAYARDYSLTQAPVLSAQGVTSLAPYFTSLSGFQFSGVVTTIPEPSSAALFGSTFLAAMLCLRLTVNRRRRPARG